MKKKIGIDARLLFQTGVGTYLQNLLHFLPKYMSPEHSYYVYCLPKDKDAVSSFSPLFIPRPSPFLWHTVGEQVGFLSTIQKDNLDLMHFTYFGHPILYSRPFISTIHDLTPLLFKTGRASTNKIAYLVKKISFNAVFRNQLFKSKAIITPTMVVKEQLVELFGQEWEAKIYHINEGLSYRLLEEKKIVENKYENYYLYVGNMYPHKNVKSLTQAFLKSGSSNKLIIAGPNDYFTELLKNGLDTTQREKVVFKTGGTLSELQALYRGAQALIHPSLSEGFGLPIIEAAHYGLPIIASDIPVFRELLGTSYYSFDPYEVTSIISAIDQFEKDAIKKKPALRQEYSFERMAEQTHKLYEKCA